MKRLLLLLGSCFCLPADTPNVWTPEFSMKIQTIGVVVPSPDGKWAAYTQTKAIAEGERSEQVSQIYLARADGTKSIQLTRGEKSSTAPSFSPDGRFLYFLSDRNGKMNVYRILIHGGEAEMLTDVKGAVGEYRLSPDGNTVAFVGHEPPPDLEKARKEKRDFQVVGEQDENFDLWTVPADAAGDKRTAKKVFESKYHVAALAWSPDSKSIAFEHWPGPLADNWTKADIAEVDVASGKVTDIAKTSAAESSPHYSPDGRYLAFDKSSDPAALARRIAHRPADPCQRRCPAAASDLRFATGAGRVGFRLQEPDLQ